MDLAMRIGPNVDINRAMSDFTSNPGFDIKEEDCWWFRNTGHTLEDFPSNNMMLSLENMFDRPWFKRLWVWQEVILARKATIFCGSRKLAWFDFRKFLLAFKLHNTCNLSRKARKNLTHIARLCSYEYFNRPSKVAELMNSMGACECSDDRDRLYGTFNLLCQDEANLVKIEPNYSKPVSEIYREFARANYEKAGDLDIMDFCDNTPKKVETERALPSWVPDVPHSKAHVSSTTSDRNLLEVTGKYCATIDSKKRILQLDKLRKYTGPGRVTAVRQAIINIAPEGVLCQQYAPMRKKTLLEAFTRTILTVFADDYSPHSNMFPPFLAAQNVVANCLQKREPSIEDRGAEDKVLIRTLPKFSGKCFFTTEEGYIGLAPDTAAPGDVLVVLLGLDMPIILRSTTNGCYNVVGTCYVYGLMSSEALLGPLPGDTHIVKYLDRSIGTSPYAFFDDEMQQIFTDDPRLGPLPQGWHFAPASVCKEKNRYPLSCREDTGEVTKFDPRLTPEALKERDPQLDLRVFKLI
ncbi:hypothetical protein CJF32_00001267 [Rutstroemia sp. NJR-2017a WRK4]|nr:hypothetical protein CJF32_00001267 [Rutstroemia sp. NJR-2017a WRK4]